MSTTAPALLDDGLLHIDTKDLPTLSLSQVKPLGSLTMKDRALVFEGDARASSEWMARQMVPFDGDGSGTHLRVALTEFLTGYFLEAQGA